MYTSERAGSFSWQSASLPGSSVLSSAVFRLVSSRAFLAASRAWALSRIFLMMMAASAGFSFRYWPTASLVMLSAMPAISEFPSLP